MAARAGADERSSRPSSSTAPTSGHKVYDTLAVIGAARIDSTGGGDRLEEPARVKTRSRSLPRWPVTVSYFEPGSRAT